MLIDLGNGNYCSQSDYCDFPDTGTEVFPLSSCESPAYINYLRENDEVNY